MDSHSPQHKKLSLEELAQATSWIFDLDNTLYPAQCNLFVQIERRMTVFVSELLSLPFDEARKVQKEYFKEYGTTMRGLMDHHNVDPQVYMSFVHDIDLSPIQASSQLNNALAKLPGKKFIFTNGSTAHAERVMAKLGIDHHFDVIHDIADSNYTPKPEPTIYHDLVSRHGIDPTRTVMVEDMARNLAPAAAMGMTCVWIDTANDWAQEGANSPHVHHTVQDLPEWIDNLTKNLT